MIDADYGRLMVRYNIWQNAQSMPVLEAMPQDALTEDRGGFFAGLLATVNHLLWGGIIRVSRSDPSVKAPAGSIPENVKLHPTAGSRAAARFHMDGKMRIWAKALDTIDLTGPLARYSGALSREVRALMAATVVHFFNHQTHHRGQSNSMPTDMDENAPVSDLFIMPEEV